MKVKITGKKIFSGIFLLGVLYLGFGGEHNIYNLWRYHKKENELRMKIEQSEAERKKLTAEIEMLQSDSTYIEKIAREEYGMAAPGETIYVQKTKGEK